MAEGENRSGLLSKMVKFVRNPTKDWAELDQKEGEAAEKGYSKEVLKEMIERKRQNDFVRKREFDHLRKLRRREPIMGLDRGGRPSFFNSSFTSNHDDRAQTLKKIDEIEAQMSRQWWKSKEGQIATPGASPDTVSRLEAGATLPPSMMPRTPAHPVTHPTDDSNFASTAASDMDGEISSFWSDDAADDARGPMPARELAPTEPMDLRHEPQPTRAAPMGAGFASQRLYAPAPTENLTDPELEDAAIRFANGDASGAESSLMAALSHNVDRPDLADLWMSALFDLYRATGQQDRFDHAAMEFANRYGRSAPAWLSMPEQLRRPASPKAASAKSSATDASPADWASPAQLKASDLTDVHALMRITGPVVLDWQALTTVMPDAVPALADMVASWCDTQAMLVFRGHGSLDRALSTLTPSGDRTVDPLCWRVRMDALRVMKLIDAFELVALDYCVTFEVSPPSWQDARSHCELQGLSDPAEAEAEDIRSHWHDPSMWEDSRRHASGASLLDDEAPATVELSGEILGDANEVLIRLEKGLENSSRLVVSCARLIRVDFSAAGSILNWAALQQSLGRQIQFRDVNRMVAAFFNVIGISEHARVVPRAV